MKTGKQANPGAAEAPACAPLPCRGCTTDCPNRNRCDGKPWRLPAAETAGVDRPRH